MDFTYKDTKNTGLWLKVFTQLITEFDLFFINKH